MANVIPRKEGIAVRIETALTMLGIGLASSAPFAVFYAFDHWSTRRAMRSKSRNSGPS
jgi:hypothetical protein